MALAEINYHQFAKYEKKFGLSRQQVEMLHETHNLRPLSKAARRFIPVEEFCLLNLSDLAQAFLACASLEEGKKCIREMNGKRIKYCNFELMGKQKIGAGFSGAVYKLTRLSLKTLELSNVAKKVAFKDRKAQALLKNEYYQLSSLRERIVERGKSDLLNCYQEVYSLESKKSESGTTISMKGKLYSGDAYDFILNNALDQKSFVHAVTPIVKGVAFLQEESLINTDIKLENCFVDQDDEGKVVFVLGDFGGVKRYKRKKLHREGNYIFSNVLIPEAEIPSYDRTILQLNALSSFMLGIALYAAATQHYPYSKVRSQVYNHEFLDIRRGPPLRFLASKCDRQIVEYIERLLSNDPSKRPQGTVLLHQWKMITQLPLEQK